MNLERGEIVVLGADVGAHLAEWGDNAFHGAFLEGGVAGNFGSEALTAEDAGEEADCGAGIFGVEGAPTGFEAVEAVAGDFDGGAFDFDVGAEGFHAAEGAVAITGGGKVAEFAGAVGEGGEHSVAVGDGFVAGKFERAGKGFDRVDKFGGHGYRNFNMRSLLER